MIQAWKPIQEWAKMVTDKTASNTGAKEPVTNGTTVKGTKPMAINLSVVQCKEPWVLEACGGIAEEREATGPVSEPPEVPIVILEMSFEAPAEDSVSLAKELSILIFSISNEFLISSRYSLAFAIFNLNFANFSNRSLSV
ncbi:hypothetical protein WICPIJ_004051 [Wickerhamomyces pijperi]|uniref:Uncharacterized protein n=1 Tax=Wickerhamomyces pijperi TaxID=599730 RepID=A0A9P8Q8F8_WICPI|nr:hypothetical protein WICPIJ_004051 [Wickerhamomyces pijperi]